MRRKFIALFILASLLCISCISVLGANNTQVLVNGNKTNVSATKINNKVYVDIEQLSGLVGLDVSKQSNSVNISYSEDERIPQLVKELSPSVVGIIGNPTKSEDNKYGNGIILGTGVVLKSGGEILTNAHVVEDLERIVVVLSDSSGYEARIKYIDKDSDLAVIKIDKIGLSPVKFGNKQDIVTGRTVIAIGTPMSFQNRNSASVGVISGFNRSIDGFYGYRLIQTDAAINPGNSGGPMVNLKGEVMGINSITTIGAQGLSYSIPVDTINYVLDHFNKYGYVNRPDLGVEFDEDITALYGLPSKNGMKVKSINTASAGAKAGLKVGDTVYSIDGVTINTNVDLNEAYKKYIPGNEVTLNVKRNNKQLNINVVLDKK